MPQLSIVVPTFNEAGNVVELRNRVAAVLPAVERGWAADVNRALPRTSNRNQRRTYGKAALR